MKVTVRPSVLLTFGSPRMREAVFLLLAALRAALISGFIYVAFGSFPPWRWTLFGKAVHMLAQVLQVPIFLFSHSVGRLVPYVASPLHFGWPEMRGMGILDQRPWLPHHLRAGVITYTLLFHIPVAVRWLRARFGAGNGQVAT
jgi:hypothetical protein